MLDLHTHILPGMDDGSKNAAQSIAMLEMEAAQGVRTVALTPHYNPAHEAPVDFARRRDAALETLQQAMADKPGLPTLLAGAEVAYFNGLCRVENIDALCIGDTRHMLVEMPFGRWTQPMLAELEELRNLRGIQPVLAHVERYLAEQPAGLLPKLIERGMLIQMNASTILHWQARWKAIPLLKRQQVHFIATDCHNLEHRPPNLGAALQKVQAQLGEEAMAWLRANGNRLLGVM